MKRGHIVKRHISLQRVCRTFNLTLRAFDRYERKLTGGFVSKERRILQRLAHPPIRRQP